MPELTHLHPAILGLLADLPAAGEPFPERDRWLVIFEEVLDYVYRPVQVPLMDPRAAPMSVIDKVLAEAKPKPEKRPAGRPPSRASVPHEPGAPQDSAGNWKHRCPGPGHHTCGAWVSRQAKRCIRCNAEVQRFGRARATVAAPDEAPTDLSDCPCVNPEQERCQTLAPLGIMMRGTGDAAQPHRCRLFATSAVVA